MKLTKQQISELTDTQLNRAMIWLYVTKWTYIYKDGVNVIMEGLRRNEGWMTSYLEDWDKLMPLVVENKLMFQSQSGENEHSVLTKGNIFASESLSRALSEALVYIKVGV